MAKAKNPKKILVSLVLFSIGLLLSLLFFKQIPTSIPHSENNIIEKVQTSLPNAKWTQLTQTIQQTAYGSISGTQTTTTINAQTASLSHFEDTHFIQSLGYTPDITLSADGPGSSVWGYKRQIQDKQQFLLFSYQTKPTDTSPNQPLQFDCPCEITVTLFLSTY